MSVERASAFSAGERPAFAAVGAAADELARRLEPLAYVVTDGDADDSESPLLLVCEDTLDRALFLHRRLLDRADRPVVFVSRSSEEAARILARELGAADVIGWSLSDREILARLNGLTRLLARAGGEREHDSVLRWRLQTSQRTLQGSDGFACQLSASECDVLIALSARPGEVLTREQLVEALDGPDIVPRSIDATISRIRRKLEGRSLISTVRGGGYTLGAPLDAD